MKRAWNVHCMFTISRKLELHCYSLCVFKVGVGVLTILRLIEVCVPGFVVLPIICPIVEAVNP